MPSTARLAAGTGSSVVVERCQVCDSPDLEPALFLGFLPPVNQLRPIGARPGEQPAYPAQLLSCARCGLVQLGLIVDALEEKIEEAQNLVRAEVTGAVPLAPDLRTSLHQALEARLGRTVVLKEKLDPELLGGLLVRVGDRLFDGTVRTRLRKLRARALDARVEGTQA